MEINRITELTDFIEQSPTAFHAVQNLKTMLDKDGFQELKEAEKWHLEHTMSQEIIPALLH